MGNERAADTWQDGLRYEQFVGRWSRVLAPPFLSWLAMPAACRWLDVGCGTGALCAAILDRCAPAAVYGVEPAAGFLAAAGERLGDRAVLRHGSATAIPLADASVDVVVSGLVLNFIPDPEAALAEMRRVTGPAGRVAAYVWDYAGRMELLRYFWDAAAALDADAATLDEAVRFPLCRPDRLEQVFAAAGCTDVDIRAIDVPTVFRDFADYWQPMLGGQGPAPTYVSSLTDAAKERLRRRLETRLPTQPDGAIALTARAWAVRAVAGG